MMLPIKSLVIAGALIVTAGLASPARAALPTAPLDRRCSSVAAEEGRLAAACAVGLSLRDPSSGAAERNLVLPGGAVDVVLSGRQALVSLGPNGLAVIDLGGDEEEGPAPRLLSIWPSPGAVYQVAALEGGAGPRRWAAADGAMGLALLEVGEQGGVRELDRLDLRTSVVGVASAPGGVILACAGEKGLVLLRVAEGRLAVRDRLPTIEAREVALAGGAEGPLRAVVADGRGGVALVAIEPAGLRLLDRLPPMGLDRCRGVGVAGGLVLSAEGTSGARLLRVRDGRLEEMERFGHLPGAVADGLIEEGPEPRVLLASDREGVMIRELSVIPADPPPADSALPGAAREPRTAAD